MSVIEAKRIVIADPRFGIHYVAYYLLGLRRLGYKIKWQVLKDFPMHEESQLARGMAFLMDGRKIFIDSNDHKDIDESIYDWCDRYAKINVKKEDLVRSKMLAIGPNFSIKLDNPVSVIALGIMNYLRSWSYWNECPKPSLRVFMKGYVYMLVRRLRFDEYCQTGQEEDGYIFTMSTLWYDTNTYSTTNRWRGSFAKACKRMMPKFEGGFIYLNSPSVIQKFPKYAEYLTEFKDLLTNERIGMKEYIEKTRRSAFVFNTPSVSGCHGWKLCEYLAMGKAIISTPLLNAMPGNFMNGQHFLEAIDEDGIAETVKTLKDNKALRVQLQHNAKQYFEEYLAPVAVVKRIFEI